MAGMRTRVICVYDLLRPCFSGRIGFPIKAGKEAAMSFGRRRILVSAAKSGAVIIAGFVFFAYFLLPILWTHYEHAPALASFSMRTVTAQGIPAEPLNAGLVGSEAELAAAFRQIGWQTADPLNLTNDLAIAGGVVLDRAYDSAPVSSLFFQGRKQDMAFEQAAGDSPDQRHHIRLWKALERGSDGRPVWLGAVSFDKGVGLSHFTGQITHHIDANLDAERDRLVNQLIRARIVSSLYQVTGAGPTLTGRNGEGDAFYTDGELTVAVLRRGAAPSDGPPDVLENPQIVRLKQTIWQAFAGPSGK
jgi:hypothetical protein